MAEGEDGYLWWKAVHIVSVIIWMAGLFYLPRLFVYHATKPVDSESSRLLTIMERRLLRGIMYPSLIAVLVTGGVLFQPWGEHWWLMGKLGLVGILVVCHFLYAYWRWGFEHGRNVHTHIFYRIMNEIPTVVLIGIVILVVLKPI